MRQPLRIAEFEARRLLRPRAWMDELRLRVARRRGRPVLPAPAQLRPPPHFYQGYRGPWIEDAFFRHWLASDRPWPLDYLPVFWTDYYLHLQTHRIVPPRYRRSERTIANLLDHYAQGSRRAFTVLEYDHPIWNWHRFPRNIVVLSAGGWGDVPIPLLKGSPAFSNPPKDVRLSFIGRLTGASDVYGIRSEMHAALRDHALFRSGPDWREWMARSVFSLCPGGLGPTSFRLCEALSVGSIPVYLWKHRRWLPYEDEIDWSQIAITLPVEEAGRLPALLAEYGPERIASMQARIAQLYEAYFTLPGACRQIERIVGRLAADPERFLALTANRSHPPPAPARSAA